MNKIIDRIFFKTTFYIASLLFVATIPLPIKYHNFAFALLFILSVVSIPWKEISWKNLEFRKLPALILMQFLIIAAGLMYTSNISAGLHDLERALYPVIVLPVILGMRHANISLHKLLQFFSFSCLTLTLYGFFYATYQSNTSSFIEVIGVCHKDFVEYARIQPLYLSIFLIFVLFFCLESIRIRHQNLSTASKCVLVITSLLVIVIVCLLKSKTALLLLPILLIIYLVIVQKKRGWLLAFSIMLVCLVVLLLDKNNSHNMIDKYGAVSKAFDQRMLIWKGAIEGIRESPFFGAGTGGTQELLNSGYRKTGFEEGITNEYNAHNQYLQFIARNGILELLVFLVMLVYSFWRSSKHTNYTYLMFNILVTFVMFIESFLSVQKGIVFFYFFFLAFNYLESKPNAHRELV